MIDLIYPRNCVGCGAPSPAPFRYLCWECYANSVRVEAPFCRCCGDPVAGAIQHDYLCYSCARQLPHFEAARSAVRYEGAVGNALCALKYEEAVWLADDLADLLAACVRAEYSRAAFDLVVPVPLHPTRSRARGYNQLALLAAALAHRMGLAHRANGIRRVRPTVSQTGLTAPQRAANVCRAFRAGWFVRLAGRKVLLVDDVMTTGATANACAAALKQGGATSVYVVTVARG